MKNPGLGVMIKTLGGDEKTLQSINACLGKTIKKVYLDKEMNDLIFNFTDNTNLKIYDGGQSCCEYRYMVCDDELPEFKNAKLLDLELKDAPEALCDWGAHEVQFLDIITSDGVFQISNHNEHNGYYGGFCIEAELF